MKNIWLALGLSALLVTGLTASPLSSPAYAQAKAQKKADACAEIKDIKKKAACIKKRNAALRKKKKVK